MCSDGEVVVKKVSWVGAVGVNTSDLCGSDNDDVWASFANVGFDGGLIAEVEFGTRRREDRLVSSFP
jgi:hypothetical protein